MKKLIILIFVFICISIFLSCNNQDYEDNFKPLTTNEITPKKLWERIAIETNYRNYNYWPGHEEFQRGQSPHGVFHKIYINNILYNSLPIEGKIAPNGSIIVKENYTSEKELEAITVMAKIDSYNPDGNDWYWIKYSNDKGTVQVKGPKGKEGIIGGCINCHKGKYDNDYIIVRPLDKKQK